MEIVVRNDSRWRERKERAFGGGNDRNGSGVKKAGITRDDFEMSWLNTLGK